MIHLLPEISHSLQDSAEKLELELLPELVVCAGFFLIYLVEEVMESLVGGHHRTDSETLQLERVERSDCNHDDRQISRLRRFKRPLTIIRDISAKTKLRLTLSLLTPYLLAVIRKVAL